MEGHLAQQSETITLLLGVGALAFLMSNRRLLARLPGASVFTAAYAFFVIAWIAAIAEGVFWGTALTLLEEACHALGAILVAAWLWRAPSGEAPRR